MHPAKHPHERALLATIFLLNAIEFLQSGMITFGAGPISGEIGASPEEFTLVTVAYAVVAIAAIAKQRWLVERLGWRGFVQASVAVYIIGAAICGSSGSFPQFFAGRVVMALAGGPFLTTSRIMVNLLPANPRRFRGIVAYAGALAFGNGIAPWLASVAISHDRWPMIFVLLSGVAGGAALFGSIALPAEATPAAQRSQSHPQATVVMAAGAFLGLYTLQRAAYDFYSNAMPLLLAILAGGGALLYFAHHQYRHERPLLALKRLMHPRYVAGMATFTLGYMVLGANNYMLPAFMQGALGFPWETIGQVQSAGLLAAVPAFCVMAMILKKTSRPKSSTSPASPC
ncbi:MFS transporter [Rugamonas sp.]|uniref:MFS transporter n=1 Tax=Rugamonas sp. TaxID=1926287 RepID=UPI0025F626CD|nr:MFS transporter [Rugamonas sp.]